MKYVEITPKIEEVPYGYETRGRRKDITETLSVEEIERVLKTSNYQAISQSEAKVSISISPEEWGYIDKYARQENVSLQIAVQWFWNQGFRLLRGTHKARETYGEHKAV